MLFTLGQIVATPGAIDTLATLNINPAKLVERHANGDWSEMYDEDAEANRSAIEHGERILSSYVIQGEKVWVITEWDRSVTTILLPSEY